MHPPEQNNSPKMASVSEIRPQRVGEDFGQRGEIVDFRDAVRQQQHAEEHPQGQQEERSPCGIARRREEESQD